jgi:hypothetical protein
MERHERDVSDKGVRLAGLLVEKVIYDANDPTVSWVEGMLDGQPATFRLHNQPYSRMPLVQRVDAGHEIEQANLNEQLVEQLQEWARYEMAALAQPPLLSGLDLTPTPMSAWDRPQLGDMDSALDGHEADQDIWSGLDR